MGVTTENDAKLAVMKAARNHHVLLERLDPRLLLSTRFSNNAPVAGAKKRALEVSSPPLRPGTVINPQVVGVVLMMNDS